MMPTMKLAGSARASRFGSVSLACLLVFGLSFEALAQAPVQSAPGPEDATSAPQLMGPQDLDNLVAPVALYPDQVLSVVLAASTYPLEIVEAQQWIQQRGNLSGAQLMSVAKQQNWDPSVQALVAFPQAMALLSNDIEWTTALGNAFLAQQSDVMNAIQDMRARARDNGRLASTPQQNVAMQAQDGQNAIQIQPADPQVVYVPTYNPQYVWGPPAYGEYPPLGYSSYGSGFSFGDAINIGTFFAGFAGLLGWGGWGWGLSWLTHSMFLNGLFFNIFGALFGSHGGYGYGGGYGGYGGYGAHSAWVHDPGHRMGVPYSNRAVATRFGGAFRSTGGAFASRGAFGGNSRIGNSGASYTRNAGIGNTGMAGRGGFNGNSVNRAGNSGWRGVEDNRSSAFASGRGQAAVTGNNREIASARASSSSFNNRDGQDGWHTAANSRGFGGSSPGVGSQSFGGSSNRSGNGSGSGWNSPQAGNQSGNRGYSQAGGSENGSRDFSNGYSQSASSGYRGRVPAGVASGGWNTRSNGFAEPGRSSVPAQSSSFTRSSGSDPTRRRIRISWRVIAEFLIRMLFGVKLLATLFRAESIVAEVLGAQVLGSLLRAAFLRISRFWRVARRRPLLGRT